MNRGIEELEKYIPEIEKKRRDELFQKIGYKFLREHNIKIKKIEFKSPYLVVKTKIDSFLASNIVYIGNQPNWDLNWGYDFYCIEACFDWKNSLVSLLFQNENESLNKSNFQPIRIFKGDFKPTLWNW